MKNKKKLAIAAILIAAVFMTGVLAQTFFLIFNQTPYSPSEYSWQQSWQVFEKVDFVEATLTLTGSGYAGDPHDAELILKNIATDPNYAIMDMDYQADWVIGADSELIIGGLYSDGLLVGETVTYTGTFTPTIIGAGNVEMSVTNIVWVEPEPITWTKDATVTGPYPSDIKVENFEITGATMSLIESGAVSFRINNINSYEPITCNYKVEVVELAITIAQGSDVIQPMAGKDYSFNIDPLPSGGALTLLISVVTA